MAYGMCCISASPSTVENSPLVIYGLFGALPPKVHPTSTRLIFKAAQLPLTRSVAWRSW